jgi:hypothetical protein
VRFFLHFIKHTKPTKEDHVVLILNGHYSHTRSLEVITRENHIDIICLSPHSSHKMQPLDITFRDSRKLCISNKLKKVSVHTQGESSSSTKLANYSEMHTCQLQQARQRLMASERQVSLLVTRTSSDHTFSVCPPNTHMLLL